MRPRYGRAPISAFSRLDLPAPFGPITVTIWPACTVSETFRTASILP
jgi:hypothetical protein